MKPLLVATLHTAPEFRRDMDAARTELAHAAGAVPDMSQCRIEAGAS
ncbi:MULTISPECIES: hypothetical protein [Sphingomonas]|nr:MULTISPECIES: hypothetical protein [Sphingomonas]MDY0967570.1 hypothetical protein [Sphingomonas sp. CFBP9021]USR00918.1 hypothetical protein NEF64_03410 [Sphingomonas aerolata]